MIHWSWEKWWNSGNGFIMKIVSGVFYHNPGLGLVTKARGLQGCGPTGRPKNHLTCSWECKECEAMNPHTFKWTPIVGVRVENGLPFLEHNYRGQNPLVRRVLYITRKLLKRTCLKLACITHLDIWNTSYDQKKGWELNW
jgi:hypothetical protein